MTAAYLLLAFGLLAIFCEFLRPGSVLPLVVGLLLFGLGARRMWMLCAPASNSLLLMSAAVLLWLLDCWRDTRYLAPLAASTSLLVGILYHASSCQSATVAPLLIIGLFISIVTSILAHLGRRARTNKWSSL